MRSLGLNVSHQPASEVRSRLVTACKWCLWNFAPLNVQQNHFHGPTISVGVSICPTSISHAFIWVIP